MIGCSGVIADNYNNGSTDQINLEVHDGGRILILFLHLIFMKQTACPFWGRLFVLRNTEEFGLAVGEYTDGRR